jgi:hypothetical protein
MRLGESRRARPGNPGIEMQSQPSSLRLVSRGFS